MTKRSSGFVSVLGICILILWGGPGETALGQNRDHPGLVHVGKGKWVTPDEAKKKGFFEYHRRWFPKKMKKKLLVWEKEDKKHSAWENARKIDSKHYRITSNVPRFILECEIEPFLDELYRTYVKVFKEYFGLSGRAANKNFIKIYHGFKDYALHEKENGQPPPRTNDGYFSSDELVVYYDLGDPAVFYSTVFHEGAHQFVVAVMPGAELPIWLDEAMAVYFEGFTYSRATRKITADLLPSDRVDTAKSILKKLPPKEGECLAEELFFNVPYERFEAEHYALAWSFVHYLIHRDNNRYRKHFAKFLKEVRGAGVRPIPEVFKKATGLDLFKVEEGWRDYVLRMKAERPPGWAIVQVEKPDPLIDLKSGDYVWSIDGIEIYHTDGLSERWKKRSIEHPLEIIVVRRIPVSGFEEYTQQYINVLIPPESPIELTWSFNPNRAYNLRD